MVEAEESRYGKRWLLVEGAPEMLFTENETNYRAGVWCSKRSAVREGQLSTSMYGRREGSCNPAQKGTKCAAHYHFKIAPGASVTVRLRLTTCDADRRSGESIRRVVRKIFDLAAR